MPYNEKAKISTMKYMKKKRERLSLNLPLGTKERYRSFAERQGKSLTELLMELFENEINKKKPD